MAALSTSTYGKATAMGASVLTDFADRMTAALQSGLGAVNDLNADIATGAPVNQASVNTLLKVMQDLGQVATDARQAAMDEITAGQPAPGAPAAPDSGTAASSSAKPASGGTAKP